MFEFPVLPEYDLIAQLSDSGFHKAVFLGQKVDDQTLWALKTYKSSFDSRLLKNEMILADLPFETSPHLSIPVYLGCHEDHHWLREPLWYTDFHRVCRDQGPLKRFDALLNVILGLFRALEAIHALECRHTDIKLDNIGVTRSAGNSVVLLGDFGCLSFDPDSVPVDDTLKGSPRSRAPELLSETPSASKAADIWAAGASIFALAIGRYPFAPLEYKREKRTAFIERYRQDKNKLFDRLRRTFETDIPPCVAKLLGPCLEERPADRPSARQVVIQTQTVLNQLATLTRDSGIEVNCLWQDLVLPPAQRPYQAELSDNIIRPFVPPNHFDHIKYD